MGGIYKHIVDDLHDVDVIIVGGGTAGCVVASRLSDADPSFSILIVERGPDGWRMPDWSANDLIPYMNKFETYHWPGSPSAHGTDGPIHISEGPFGPTKLQGQFIKAPARVGFPESVDLQNLDSNQAVQRTLRFVSSDGIRQDAAHAYLQPKFQNGNDRNLFVLVEHKVVRVMVEDTRVAGIEVRSNPVFQNSTQVHKIKASKMVVVSAGTLGTSMLLEQSGVGDRNVLSLAGVNVVVELPGVGMDLQDDNTMLVSYYSSLGPDETYDDILDSKTMYQKLLEQKSRMLIWNTAETTSKVRPTNKEIESLLGLPALKL